MIHNLIGKKDHTELRIADMLVERGKITDSQAKEAVSFIEDIKRNGRPYLGYILVEHGFVKDEVLYKYLRSKEKYFLDYCKKMVKNGFMKKTQYSKVLQIRKENPQKEIAEIVIESGFMGRDTFYNFFSNNYKLPSIGKMMLKAKEITEEQLTKALQIQKTKTVEDYLMVKEIIGEEELKEARIISKRSIH